MKKLGRNGWILILLGVLGALLLLLGGLLGQKDGGRADRTDYAAYLEARARTLCMSIDGIEAAEVFLTLDGGEALSAGSFGQEAKSPPRVRGVAVVCTNGDRPAVREAVTELLAAALDVPSSRVKVRGG